jgi:hypothetical protein
MRYAMSAALLSLALAAPAMAQGPGGGGRGGMGFMGGPMIAGMPAVQSELKLSDEQIAKVTELLEAARGKMEGLRSQLEGVAREERMAKMRELMAPINEEVGKGLAGVLDAAQSKRLGQIAFQMDARMRGADALLETKVKEGLKLTAEQAEKVQALATEMNAQRRTIMQEAQGDFQGAMAKFNTLREETMTKVMALMSDDQKSLWKEMTGAPFEMQFGGGGGGGRGPVN